MGTSELIRLEGSLWSASVWKTEADLIITSFRCLHELLIALQSYVRSMKPTSEARLNETSTLPRTSIQRLPSSGSITSSCSRRRAFLDRSPFPLLVFTGLV
jgi:hypothetical protein